MSTCKGEKGTKDLQVTQDVDFFGTQGRRLSVLSPLRTRPSLPLDVLSKVKISCSCANDFVRTKGSDLRVVSLSALSPDRGRCRKEA